MKLFAKATNGTKIGLATGFLANIPGKALIFIPNKLRKT